MKEFKFCPMCGARLKRSFIEGKNRLACPGCGWIRYKNPLPVAQCVARSRDGRLVIIKRDVQPGKGKWALPGGFIEGGEDPEKACLRELREETGLEGKVLGIIGIYIQKDEMYGPVIISSYEILLKNEKFEVRDEVQAVKLVYRRDMPAMHFSSHRKILKDYFKENKY